MPKTLLIIIGVYLAACYLYGMYWVARLIWMKRHQQRSIKQQQIEQPVVEPPSVTEEPKRLAA